MIEQSFLWPLAGGLMIGLSAALYLLLSGRIAGITGITSTAFGWMGKGYSLPGILFLIGILAGAGLASAWLRPVTFTITSSPLILLAGGLIVGFGARLGSGCTSGHGVCGLARLSPRSIVATMTFMAVAAATVFVSRHLIGAV